MKKTQFFFLLFSLLSIVQIQAIQHPCLLITKEMYPALKASGKGTSTMHASNSGYANAKWNLASPTKAATGTWAWYFSVPLASNALLYVQNYDNETLKSSYRAATLSLIRNMEIQKPFLGNGDHPNTVYAAAAFVNAVIAVDIMHDDFTAAQLQSCDSVIDDFSTFFNNGVFLSGSSKGKKMAWETSWQGASVVYHLYKDNKDSIPVAINRYKTTLLRYEICSDGTWLDSPGYLHARLAGDRVSKWCPIDIVTFMGYYNFYKDPRLIKTMDWLNSFSLTPWGAFVRLGETGLTGITNFSTEGLMYRMNCFSPKAAATAAWFIGSKRLSTSSSPIFDYVLAPITLPAPIAPTSSLFKFSGASFWDHSNSSEGLQGVLFCPQREVPTSEHATLSHCSSDANSVSINAYGEYMLMNAGTNYYPSYPGTRPDGGRWNDAWMQNVVLVDGKKLFVDNAGNGLVDLYGLKDADGIKMGHGLVGGMIEFAETSISTATTGNANHWRTLFSVKPVAGQSNGYFLLRDKVQSAGSKVVTMMLHPNSVAGSVKSVLDKAEYQSTINGFLSPKSNGTEKINLFYATKPDSVSIRQSWEASFTATNNTTSTNKSEQHNFLGDYLRSSYKTAVDGYVRFATVLFPEDSLHAKAKFSRITDVNYSGVQITHNASCIDYFLVPNAAVANFYKAYSFNGESVFYRTQNGVLSNYAVANGVKLSNGEPIPTGFSSDKNISIEFDDKKGTILSAGARVTFYLQGIKEVKLNNQSLKVVSATANALVVDIPAGKQTLEIVSSLPSAVLITAASTVTADADFVINYSARTKLLNILNKNHNKTIFELMLSDIHGKTILNQSFQPSVKDPQIDVSTLPAGLYVWTITNENKRICGKVQIL